MMALAVTASSMSSISASAYTIYDHRYIYASGGYAVASIAYETMGPGPRVTSTTSGNGSRYKAVWVEGISVWGPVLAYGDINPAVVSGNAKVNRVYSLHSTKGTDNKLYSESFVISCP